jgi:hypothetical protein
VNTQETFTSEEIIDLFKELDCDVFFRSQSDSEVGVASIECELGPIVFTCVLLLDEPFFEYLALFAFRYDVENCSQFANELTRNNRYSHAVVHLDSEGMPEIDDDGDITVEAAMNISFAGGVSREHTRYLLEMWIEELVDFYEIDLETVESVEEIDVEIPQSPEFLEMPLAERITAYLSLDPSRTAREMGKILGFDRHEINRVLYKHRDRFVKNKSQPPHWNLKGND